MRAGKGNEVKLGENSASKEVSAGPQLRGTKPLPVAISLTGAPAGRRGRQPLGTTAPGCAPSKARPFNLCPGKRGVKGSKFHEDESTVQPEGKGAVEHKQVGQVRVNQQHR